jgi:hypothetical protein
MELLEKISFARMASWWHLRTMRLITSVIQ